MTSKQQRTSQMILAAEIRESETLGYQGSDDILISRDGSFISPALDGDIEDGCIAVWTASGYKVRQAELDRNQWVDDYLDANNCFIA